MNSNDSQIAIIRKVIEDCSGQVKWSGLSALEHLKNARSLSDSHPALSAFSAICAEEEAAAALIHSLKALKYPGAKKILFTSHPHKHAIFVFLNTVVSWFKVQQCREDWPFQPLTLERAPEGRRMAVRVSLAFKGASLRTIPVPPLNLQVGGESSLEKELKTHIMLFMESDAVPDIRKKIEESAGYRNSLLYAVSNGLPKGPEKLEEFIDFHTSKVLALLMAVGLIDPWKKYPHSPIVVTCIQMLVAFMDRTVQSSAQQEPVIDD